MAVPWQALQQKVDAVCDGMWGEKAILVPWIPGQLSGGGKIDPSRPTVAITVGFVERGGMVTTGGGNTAAFNTRAVISDAIMSVTMDNLQGLLLKKDDRVVMVDRGYRQYSVAYREPSATRRPKFHLLEVNAGIAMRFGTADQSLDPITQDAEGTVV